MKKRLVETGIIVAVSVIVVAAVLAFVFSMMRRDSKPAVFEVSNGKLDIRCTFGVTVPLSEIRDLTLADSMPRVVTKTNGAGIGSVDKGEFTLENDVKARLYADTKKPPFVSFLYNGTVFYLNAGAPAETQALYEQLEAAVK